MRLGAWPCKLEPGSFAHKAYGKLEISERHRHRYEFNREHEKTLVDAGLKITGRTPDENYVKSWKPRTIRGFWAASFIRNLSQSLVTASVVSRHSSEQRCNIKRTQQARCDRSYRNSFPRVTARARSRNCAHTGFARCAPRYRIKAAIKLRGGA